MKFSTLFAIFICAILPIASYFIVKDYTDNKVKIPKRYFFDRVENKVEKGKKISDTVWHRVKNLEMINQFGDTVSFDDLQGKVLLVNFFFTSCPTICRPITQNLRKVQETILKDTSIHMISISLDPKRDSTKTLFKYATENGAKHDNWWFARLLNDSVEQVMYKEFKTGFQRVDGSIEIIHSEDVFLLDKNRVIRGKHTPAVITEDNRTAKRFYDGLDTTDLFFMMNDAGLIKMERTERTKPPFAILIASTVLMGLVFLFIMLRNRNKKKIVQAPKN